MEKSNTLTAIQCELNAPKNQFNKFGNYKYRSCEDILTAVKPLLEKFNSTLIITDEIKTVGDYMYVESTCIFNNDITIKAQAGINPDRKGMDIAQSFGSSSSYARKYALNGLFLIDDSDSKEPDTQPPPTVKPNKNKTPETVEQIIKSATEFYKIAENKKLIPDDKLDKFNSFMATIQEQELKAIKGFRTSLRKLING